MADLVDDAVAALPDNGQCIVLDVVTATVADVAFAQDEVRDGEDDVLPDLWVPDSLAWQSVLTKVGRTGKVLVPALASPRLVMSDPKASGASSLALLTPFAEGDAACAGGDWPRHRAGLPDRDARRVVHHRGRHRGHRR